MLIHMAFTGSVTLRKWAGNPILVPRNGSYWEAAQARNPAVVFHNGEVHLIYTAAGDMDIEHKLYLGHAVSQDGYHFERVREEPLVSPSSEEFEGFDAGGVEDPRAVVIDGTVYITYCARSVPHWSFILGERLKNPPTQGVTWTENYRRGGLLETKDFKTIRRRGPITTDDHYDSNVILFPEKIGGQYVMMHRPTYFKPEIEVGGTDSAGISICFSDDLVNWHGHRPLAGPEFPWEDGKIGGASPPVRTDAGWLTLYHSVEKRPQNSRWHHDYHFCYRAGVMLLDLQDPTRVLARCPYAILEPEAPFERFGTVNNVVFPTGNIVMGDDLMVYYGAADTVCCLATIPLQELLDYVLRFPVA